ncbi:hypothetical protein KUL42_16740 [Alteromonas sp. KUL42]|uniref:hypothetical protein n=1 Tax=Alteromonas sp. KUL42 TaxID=2480797 RepID=UPI0010FFAFF8|nr:hypothetical protein [Alteromonas sp. KUL42]GEA06913.1 hypothetical protein KUL42_16740 [Alteromonas sp. KUL42]
MVRYNFGSGYIEPSGVILIFFPFAYIGLGIGGAILGLLMFLTEKLIKKYA